MLLNRGFERIMRSSDERWAEGRRESELRFAAALQESSEFTERIQRESNERYEAFVRESNERHAAVSDRLMRRMEASEQHFIEALAENTAEIRRIGEGQEESREQLRANTRAVLSVLDRLDGLEGGAARA